MGISRKANQAADKDVVVNQAHQGLRPRRPNPPQAAKILAELDLPHEIELIHLSEVKEPEYLLININGRLPAIYDPNTDLTLWGSGAIGECLIERYDTAHKFSFAPGTKESYLAK